MNPTTVSQPVDKDQWCRSTFEQLVGTLGLYVGDQSVAEELAQETLIRALTRWPDVAAMANSQAWAYRVGFNLAKSRFRRLAAERRAVARMQPPQTELRDDPTTDVLRVRSAIGALTARQREAVIGRFYLDLSIPMLAESMGCAAGTAKAHLRDGLAALRIGGLEIEEDDDV